jgi:hypothetical protein
MRMLVRLLRKWLPKYATDAIAIPILVRLLNDTVPEVGWWAAVHLSRMAPEIPGLINVWRQRVSFSWMDSTVAVHTKGLGS